MSKAFTELRSVVNDLSDTDSMADFNRVRHESMDMSDIEDDGPETTPVEPPNDTAEDSCEDEEPLQSKDWKLLWCSSPFIRKTGSSKKKLKLKPGPTKYASSHAKDIKSCFQLFMPNSIENIILHMTNKEGRRVHKESWTMLDRIDLQAFTGLMILTGVYRSKNESIESLWHDRTGRAIFQTAMPVNQFLNISRIVRFDDHETTCARFQKDTLAPIRDVWDKWVDLLPCMYNPGPEVTVGERLVPFRGHCPFRHYTLRKPGRCGIKLWVACDAKSSYAWNVQLDAGKAADGKAEKNRGARVVLDVTQGLRGHNVTCDRSLTSYALGKELLKRKLTMVGAVRQSKPELPPQLVDTKGRGIFSSKFAFTQTHALVSYIPRKYQNVLVMSTRHSGAGVSSKSINAYSCKQKTNRWPLVLFFTMLDVSAYNASVVWTEVNPDWNKVKFAKRRTFLEELGKALVSPQMERRKPVPRPYTCASDTTVKEQAAVKPPDANSTPSKSKRKRCRVCARNKTSTVCQNCNAYICKVHAVITTRCYSCK
ncbi:piggyBac transposable element-derived protein 4-like isoform X2 [Triplophysa rosa]|uniref:piggyBac transposable element-derived protein 4-like isoform X2 n=1 Tax=Triplophysa rosa TaxID=992332 RepID=UPI002545C89A|nr:piggyBac transposable element-derived protein 4-like isoform X2 [Triplophysa rosa]